MPPKFQPIWCLGQKQKRRRLAVIRQNLFARNEEANYQHENSSGDSDNEVQAVLQEADDDLELNEPVLGVNNNQPQNEDYNEIIHPEGDENNYNEPQNEADGEDIDAEPDENDEVYNEPQNDEDGEDIDAEPDDEDELYNYNGCKH